MTGATGDLTPDEIQRDFEPGEWREASDPLHQGQVTEVQASRAPAQLGEVGEPGGEMSVRPPTNMANREAGYGSEHGLSPDDPAYRMEVRAREPQERSAARETRIGGDNVSDRDEHL